MLDCLFLSVVYQTRIKVSKNKFYSGTVSIDRRFVYEQVGFVGKICTDELFNLHLKGLFIVLSLSLH